MAPLIDRLVRTVGPAPSLGTCLVCHGKVRDNGGAVRVPGGGFVHHGCTTYRMRRRGGHALRPASRRGRDKFTGE